MQSEKGYVSFGADEAAGSSREWKSLTRHGMRMKRHKKIGSFSGKEAVKLKPIGLCSHLTRAPA
jgi:hypothetical protein